MEVVASGHPLWLPAHELYKIVEQITRIVRTGRGFRMVLHAEDRMVAQPEAFERLIVEIHVRDFHVARVERIRVHREAVIVRRDLHLLRYFVAHRMVGAAVAEFQLIGLAAKREPQQLVPQADAEDRLLADEFANVGHLGLQRFGVARAVRKEHAIGLERQHIFGGGEGWDHRYAAAHLHQAAQNVVLDAVIVGHYVVFGFGRPAHQFRRRAGIHGLGPFIAFERGDAGGQIQTGHGGNAARAFHQLPRVGFNGREHAAHHTASAQVADQRAGIETRNHGYAGAAQKGVRPRIRTPVAGDAREFADRQTFNIRTGRLVVPGAGSIVADLWIREDDDLAGIGGIGEYFLVAGEGGVEYDLSGPLGRRTKTLAFEDRAVFQGEGCGIQFRLFLPGSG